VPSYICWRWAFNTNYNTTSKPNIMVQKTYFKTKDYCKVKFSLSLENIETVEILGLNSDWENSIVMSKKKDGSFSAEVNLPKDSKHEFKYRLNEHSWMNEPEADEQVSNGMGDNNSLLVL
jgi:hypothetical protein